MESAAAFTDVALSTDPGLERLLVQEWESLATTAGIAAPHHALRPFGLKGFVRIKIPAPHEQAWPLIQQLHSVHHAFRVVHFFKFGEEDPLKQLEQWFEELDFYEAKTATRFRITSLRSGEQAFSSYDVAVLTGAIINRRYDLPVNLEDYDLDIRVQIQEEYCWIGIQWTRVPLSQRFERPYFRRVSLKLTTAWALLQLADIPPASEATLLDPFCGSGTILLEAAAVFPHLQLYGSDLFPEVVEGASQNLAAFDLSERVSLRQQDARHLSEHWAENSVDVLVTNPPFGLQMGRKLNLFWFYHDLLAQAARIVKPDGRVVMLVLKANLLRQVIRKEGNWHSLRTLGIELGSKQLRAFVLVRRKPKAAPIPQDAAGE
ncbi:MAG: methyltransferase domain-containing protein [Bacteroidota bacterium]